MLRSGSRRRAFVLAFVSCETPSQKRQARAPIFRRIGRLVDEVRFVPRFRSEMGFTCRGPAAGKRSPYLADEGFYSLGGASQAVDDVWLDVDLMCSDPVRSLGLF